jgi:exonuclease III
MTVQQFYKNESLWVKEALVQGHARCLLGAVNRCYGDDDLMLRKDVLNKIKAALPPDYRHSIMAFNDAEETTFADIRRVIEKANV